MVVVAPPPPPVMLKVARQPAAGADQTAPVSVPMGRLSPVPVGSACGGVEAVADCVAVGVPEEVAPRESVAVGVALGVGVGEHSVM